VFRGTDSFDVFLGNQMLWEEKHQKETGKRENRKKKNMEPGKKLPEGTKHVSSRLCKAEPMGHGILNKREKKKKATQGKKENLQSVETKTEKTMGSGSPLCESRGGQTKQGENRGQKKTKEHLKGGKDRTGNDGVRKKEKRKKRLKKLWVTEKPTLEVGQGVAALGGKKRTEITLFRVENMEVLQRVRTEKTGLGRFSPGSSQANQ